MAELKRLFNRGIMNKDLDERLVPNGEYRDALNIQVDTSESSEVGTVQNILGNTLLNNALHNSNTNSFTTHAANLGLSNPKCIGAMRHDPTECVYWYIVDDNGSYIAEYDQTANLVSPVLVDRNSVLNFSSNNLITGINIIDGLLFWTDDNSEPKRINISNFKEYHRDTGAVNNFTTHTEIDGRDFVEHDVTVIKSSPLRAPDMYMSSVARATLNNDNVFTESVVATSTTVSSTTFVDSEGLIVEPGTTIGDVGSGGQITNGITFNSDPTDFQVNDIILLTSNDVDSSDPETIRATITALQDTNVAQIAINSIDSSITSANLNWDVELEQKEPLFEFKFPRFSTRWKYNDGEYSTIGPWTNVAFLPTEFFPKKFKYNTKEGYNLSMVNNARKIILRNIVPDSCSSTTVLPIDIVEVDILYKESNNNNIYTVKTIKSTDKAWTSNEFTIESEQIYSLLPANQILRPFDNVPRKAKAQEITANRLMYGNYLHQYNLTKKDGTDIDITLNTTVETYNPKAFQVGTLNFPTSQLRPFNVTGTDTLFETTLSVGDELYLSGTSTFIGTVESISSNTALELSGSA